MPAEGGDWGGKPNQGQERRLVVVAGDSQVSVAWCDFFGLPKFCANRPEKCRS